MKIKAILPNGLEIVANVAQLIENPNGSLTFHLDLPGNYSGYENYQPIRLIETEPLAPAVRKGILANCLSAVCTDLTARKINIVNAFY
ncbi:MAG: hypothetical protein IKD90_12200 [Clostridiales bacterium]|nr:hypothetical protein [Clostridiales bacterium]